MIRRTPEALLKDFREQLREALGNRNTADRYYYAVCGFLREYKIDDLSKITAENVLEALGGCKTRNRCSALKLGLKHLSAYAPELDIPKPEDMDALQHGKRDRSVLPPKTIYSDRVEDTVKRLRDKKLKYAYRLMMDSGLRVSEAAALEKEDIQCSGDGITVHVRHGKGGSNGYVTCLRDPYLEKRLPAYLNALPEDTKPFYAAQTMKCKAVELGLECHDFRRIAAIRFRQERMEERRRMKGLEIPSVPEIDEETKDFLRHERFSTTKRYLYNRKLKVRLPEQPEKGDERSTHDE